MYQCISAVGSLSVLLFHSFLYLFDLFSRSTSKYVMQVMSNAVDMVAKEYEADVYNKEGTDVYPIPCDTDITGFDRYPMDRSDAEREGLMNATHGTDPELVAEFRLLMIHHRCSILRDEFVKCSEADCPICSHKRWWKNSKLDRILERFPGEMLPTPVPTFLPGDDHPALSRGISGQNRDCSDDSDSDEPCVPCEPESDNPPKPKRAGRYRTLGDLLKLSVPEKLLYPDSFYGSAADLLLCTACPKPFKVFKTKSGLERHRKLYHVL